MGVVEGHHVPDSVVQVLGVEILCPNDKFFVVEKDFGNRPAEGQAEVVFIKVEAHVTRPPRGFAPGVGHDEQDGLTEVLMN